MWLSSETFEKILVAITQHLGKLVHCPQSIWKFGMPLVPLCCAVFSCCRVQLLSGSSVHGDSPGKNTRVGCHGLLQGIIFPTQGSNPGLPQCRQILYQLSHNGSPSILEWVAYPCSTGSSQPRNRTGVSWLQADSLPAELLGKPLILLRMSNLIYFNCE